MSDCCFSWASHPSPAEEVEAGIWARSGVYGKYLVCFPYTTSGSTFGCAEALAGEEIQAQ